MGWARKPCTLHPKPTWSALSAVALPVPPQLIPLCIRHRLFAALVHIFTRALADHQTPAALLLVASAAAAEAEAAAEAAAAAAMEARTSAELLAARQSLRLGYKLLVFLRCCLLGLSYPPGASGWSFIRGLRWEAGWRAAGQRPPWWRVRTHRRQATCLARAPPPRVPPQAAPLLPLSEPIQVPAWRRQSRRSVQRHRRWPSCCTAPACRVGGCA